MLGSATSVPGIHVSRPERQSSSILPATALQPEGVAPGDYRRYEGGPPLRSDAILGQELVGELRKNLEAGEQSILFINRRGTSRMVVCTECGESPVSPAVPFRLTWHHKANGRPCATIAAIQSHIARPIVPCCGAPWPFPAQVRSWGGGPASFPGVESCGWTPTPSPPPKPMKNVG